MIPVAVSGAGWAVIGTIGGVVLATVVAAAVDAVFEWRRERKLAKAGARLVAAEIAGYDSHLESAERERKWWRFYGVEIASWDEYRNVLAVKLSQEEFEAVSQCVMVLEGMRRSMPELPGFRNDPDLPFVQVKPDKIEPMRKETALAYNALAKFAGHGKEGEIIERPTRPFAND